MGIRKFVNNFFMNFDAFLIFTGIVSPKANFIKRFLISSVLFQNHLKTAKNPVKVLIIIIYICQFKEKFCLILPRKVSNGFFKQVGSLFVIIQRQVSVCFQNI